MKKLSVAICVLFVAVCAIEARDCIYFSDYCVGKECCGEIGDLRCSESCENFNCSSHDDCGTSCCSNGKCGPPTVYNSQTTSQVISIHGKGLGLAVK